MDIFLLLLHVLLILDKSLKVFCLLDLSTGKFGGVPEKTEIKEKGREVGVCI
jgi:hypothetical protein